MTLKEKMEKIWKSPIVQEPRYICIWHVDDDGLPILLWEGLAEDDDEPREGA